MSIQSRLAKLKAQAAKVPGATWQSRYFSSRVYAGKWSADGRKYYCDRLPAGIRHLGSAYEVCRREGSRRVDNQGWYMNNNCDGTVSGHVLQLPARDGKPRYIPATVDSDSDCVTLWPLEWHDNPVDAAASADHEAEQAAEKARDYDSAWQAGARYRDSLDESAKSRLELRALLSELRTHAGHFGPAICATLKDSVRGMLRDLEEARGERAKLAAGEGTGREDWLFAFWTGDRELRAAFNDGAGRKVLS